MPAVDTCLFVGACPFRDAPSAPSDLLALRKAAGLSQGAATGYSSIFYHDPSEGLKKDLDNFLELADWLSFYAVVNPDFPNPEKHVQAAALERRVVGLRLIPCLHHVNLSASATVRTVRAAAEAGLPVTITARLFDGRIAPRCVQQAEPNMQHLVALLNAVPEATIVLSMFFFAELAAMKVDWDELPNVFIDLGCSKPTVRSFDTLPDWFTPERVLLGTGAPFYYWKGSRLALEASQLTSDQKQAILKTTAEEVLRWD
ncbi:MAG: amidohydrolase family protein [Lentisphaerae bacterium]|nr:amidohydrolase family protein [Lentisphaerota bacterium]MBT4814120.1 amidohydrolase family protein [Lentisphaerota bacterium]MBT5606129.1 amidohydrolase family protein [Lentisphaerota bacterium]MBT7060198.1 amidohydrolase family protein [Lentisphaerota bacterium]MBT7840420.1 amidohydrolase family protein [Lentisphaerota bacterium]